mmetsp:Transcript_11008/g.31564  ORF Transcript_11008/g.31564 Transcript_11008/m.31564 type:complete len:256 (+) Transcript_11008:3715-4482(+)
MHRGRILPFTQVPPPERSPVLRVQGQQLVHGPLGVELFQDNVWQGLGGDVSHSRFQGSFRCLEPATAATRGHQGTFPRLELCLERPQGLPQTLPCSGRVHLHGGEEGHTDIPVLLPTTHVHPVDCVLILLKQHGLLVSCLVVFIRAERPLPSVGDAGLGLPHPPKIPGVNIQGEERSGSFTREQATALECLRLAGTVGIRDPAHVLPAQGDRRLHDLRGRQGQLLDDRVRPSPREPSTSAKGIDGPVQPRHNMLH